MPRVLVLAHKTWLRSFGGDPDVIGHRLTEPYTRQDHTIVGVAPAGLDYPAGVDFWIPHGAISQSLHPVIRIASGASPATVQSELLGILQRSTPNLGLRRVTLVGLREAILGNTRPALIVLLSAIMLLLLVACVNVGNVLLIRVISRTREIATRRALGARPADIVRQFVTESTLLGLIGGAGGVATAIGLIRIVSMIAPAALPRADLIGTTRISLRVFSAVTGAAILICAAIPGFAAWRQERSSAINAVFRSWTAPRAQRRVQDVLVACQITIAVVLLAGAGLLARSLYALERVELGYNAENLAILTVAMPSARYDTQPQLVALGERVLERWAAVPGVVALTPVLIPPFLGANVWQWGFEAEGAPPASQQDIPAIPVEVAGPGYLSTVQPHLIRGRGFERDDVEGSPPVVVVSESVARHFWQGEDPLGKRIRLPGAAAFLSDGGAWRTVVGVVADTRYRALRQPNPTVYLPWRQALWQGVFAIRTDRTIHALLPALRAAVNDIDPQLSVWQARTLDDLRAAPLAQSRLITLLLSGFAVAALVLFAVGLYSVVAHTVRQQNREIAIRMALGSTPFRQRRRVFAHALRLMIGGAAVGLVVAVAVSRLFESLLFEVHPDVVTLAGVSLILLLTGLIAAYGPSRRATRVDPAIMLRTE